MDALRARRRIAEGWEREPRDGATKIFAEMSGKHAIPLGKTEFLLTARADRIERRADGSYALLDYKQVSRRPTRKCAAGLPPSLNWKRQSCAKAVSRKFLPPPRCRNRLCWLKGGDPGEQEHETRSGTPDN